MITTNINDIAGITFSASVIKVIMKNPFHYGEEKKKRDFYFQNPVALYKHL